MALSRSVRNNVVGLGLLSFVGGVYWWTMHRMQQDSAELLAEEIESMQAEVDAVKAKAPKQGTESDKGRVVATSPARGAVVGGLSAIGQSPLYNSAWQRARR